MNVDEIYDQMRAGHMYIMSIKITSAFRNHCTGLSTSEMYKSRHAIPAIHSIEQRARC